MGQTLNSLSERKISDKAIFNNRFVVEICEKVHVHYRNLRLILSLKDWLQVAQGMKDSLDRWQKIGNPQPGEKHIELCRKEVATEPVSSNEIKINLNKNLYIQNEGKIFAEGAELQEETYVHLKIRDIRIELTQSEFKEFADAVLEAKESLNA